MSVLSTLFFFLVALAILIIFHEFGHFYAARKFNVRVIRFSIGFGKPILKYVDKKGTEFVVSLIPLGGYVKMLGESSSELIPDVLKPYAFYLKSVWARMAIIAAGPLFNFLLAILALWGMFLIGVVSLAPIVGTIKPHSIAAHAHLHKMDQILSIDDKDVNTWQDVQMTLASMIGENKSPVLRVYNMKTKLYDFVKLDLKDLQLNEKKPNLLAQLGISPALPPLPPIINKVYKNYPGAVAGLKKGDRIIAVNGKRVHDWLKVVSIVQKMPHEKVVLSIRRKGEIQEVIVYPELKKGNNQKEYGFIGVEARIPKNLDEIWLRKEHYSIWSAWSPAIQQTWGLTKLSFNMIGKLLTGTVSLHTISGPIGIAQWAGQAAQLGWAHYLSFIALVSISLGVLNLLPIPILDGGHLLYSICEVILRRPVSERARLIGGRLGFILLVALMLLAIFNDLSRFNLS